MADDDDEVPEGGPTMQVDGLADDVDVLSDDAVAPPMLPPALPPPLPPKKRAFPVLLALGVAVVAIGAGLLVGEWVSPDAPEAAAAPPAESASSTDDAAPEGPPPQIDLGPILVEASHDAGSDAGEAP